MGRLPTPDVLFACTNICQTVLFWYRVLADRFRVPLILIDTPFVYYETAPEHAVAYVRRQLEDAVPIAERIAGRSLNERRLRETGRLSKMASELWMEIMVRNRHRPAPISVIDQFTPKAPVVGMRGGMAAAENDQVLARLPLPIAGLMSDQPIEFVHYQMEGLLRTAHQLGSHLHDPFMAMSFLALPVIPSLKITDKGLVDVDKFQIVPLFAD